MPDPCGYYRDQVQFWQTAVTDFEATGPPKKPNLVPGWQTHLTYLQQQLSAARTALRNCVSPPPPPPPTFSSSFNGTATLYVGEFGFQYEPFQNVGMQFQDYSPITLSIVSFPKLTAKIKQGTLTVTLPDVLLPIAYGHFDAGSGAITDLSLPLHVHEDLEFPYPNGDDDITFVLATVGSVTSADGKADFTGANVDAATGNVTLVGSSTFAATDNGNLSEQAAQIEITGTISPLPSWPTAPGVPIEAPRTEMEVPQ